MTPKFFSWAHGYPKQKQDFINITKEESVDKYQLEIQQYLPNFTKKYDSEHLRQTFTKENHY